MESIVAREVSREVANQWGTECAEIADRKWKKDKEEWERTRREEIYLPEPWTGLMRFLIAAVFGDDHAEISPGFGAQILIHCGWTADMVLAGMC
jgi:hypothetical protein